MSAEQAKEILYKIPFLGIEYTLKTFNFYANTAVKLKMINIFMCRFFSMDFSLYCT